MFLGAFDTSCHGEKIFLFHVYAGNSTQAKLMAINSIVASVLL